MNLYVLEGEGEEEEEDGKKKTSKIVQVAPTFIVYRLQLSSAGSRWPHESDPDFPSQS